jgi:hypothetical protein
VEVLPIDSSHATVAVTHVFAEANIRDDDELGRLCFDRAHCLLDDALFGVGAAGCFIFFARNSEEQDSLQA